MRAKGEVIEDMRRAYCRKLAKRGHRSGDLSRQRPAVTGIRADDRVDSFVAMAALLASANWARASCHRFLRKKTSARRSRRWISSCTVSGIGLIGIPIDTWAPRMDQRVTRNPILIKLTAISACNHDHRRAARRRRTSSAKAKDEMRIGLRNESA